MAKVAYDDNADGKTDRVALNTYDGNGNLVKTEYHNDGVETNPTNRVETYGYDVNGKVNSKSIDADGDGKVDVVETYTLNDKGQITGTSYADATGNVYKSETYVLNNNGNWLEKHVNEDGKVNTGNDQGVDRIEKYELNAKGEAIKISYDDNADSAVDKVEHIVVDANGHWVAKYVNADNDTKGENGQPTGNAITLADGRQLTGVDKIETYTLNAKGEVVEILYDNDADRSADSHTEIVRDVNGYVVEEKRDVTNNGSIDKVTQYTVDAQGRQLTSTDYNQLADGSLVQTQREEYTLDENGNRIGMTRYTGTNTEPTVVETYEVNALGQRTKALIDNYGDKVIDRAEIYTLDANGRISKIENDIGNTGTINSNTTYVRDALGQVLEQSTDANNDGNIDSRTIYELDIYGNALVSKMYNGSSDTPNGIYTRTFNSLNQVDTLVFDRTGNGLSSDDTTYTYTYDGQGRKTEEVRYRAQTGEKLVTVSYEYGDDTLVLKRNEDWDGNGVIDSNKDRIYSFTYDPVWRYDLTESATDGTGTPIHTLYIERNDAGQVLRTLTDTKSTGSIDRLNFGSMSGDYTVNHQEDFTQWSVDRFTQLKGLNQITLSNARYSTEITLDQAVIGKLAPTGTVAGKASSLTINGDATDTVNLEGNGFTKLDTTQKIGSNTFDMYTTTVNDTTYTLFIDNDVNTVLG